MVNSDEYSKVRLPKYRVDGFSTSFKGESTEFITLHVRLRGNLLHIEISPSNLRNSPTITEDFYKYFKVAQSGLDALDDDLMLDLFDWATKPFLPLFRDQELLHASKQVVTLQDFLYPETFDCEFTAVDDEIVPRHVQRREIHEFFDSDFGDELSSVNAQLRTIHPSKVELISEDPDESPDLSDVQPQKVSTDGQILYFKSADMLSKKDLINAIKKYLRIATLGPDLHTSQLYGIVADERNPLIGLLLYYIDAEDTLAFAVETNSPEALKNQWSSQITDTLVRLHRGGVVWGDVKPDNVLIDKSNNAWIIDFEGGHTEGWVDREKAGTMEGDLQGLAKTVTLIFEEKMLSDYSGDEEYDDE